MSWFVALSALFILSVLYLVLRKPGEGNLWVQALLIPVATSILLIVAITALVWGLQVEADREVTMGGWEFDLTTLRETSTNLGIGIITGIVAGAVLSAAQRWHDFERTVDWGRYVREEAERAGFTITEVEGGGFLISDDG